MQVGVGHSEAVESAEAIHEAIKQCKEGLGTSIPNVAIMFSAICYEYSKLLEGVQKEFPGIQLIGCTTDGELSSIYSFLDDSVVLICLSSEGIKFSTGSSIKMSSDPALAVKNAIEEAKTGLDCEAKLCIAYYDSLTSSGTAVLEALQEQLGDEVFIFGGVAGDQWNMKKTYQFHNGEVLNDAITIMLIGGDLIFSSGVSTGRMPFGNTFTITKSENNVVHTIDNMTGADFYKKHLGKTKITQSENPLAILIEGSEEFYLRSPLVYLENGAIAFAADVIEGSKVRLTRSTADTVIQSIVTVSSSALDGFSGEKFDLALISSCASRKWLLGTRTHEEIDLLKSSLPKDIAIGGYYAYGEICPIKSSTKSKFHNETFIILLLGEKY